MMLVMARYEKYVQQLEIYLYVSIYGGVEWLCVETSVR